MYYRSKITLTKFTHTCDLNTRSYREARLRSGVTLPDLTDVQDLVYMLHQWPTLSCANLRPFVVRYMPHYQAADAQIIVNLRRIIAGFILLHEFDDLPTSNDAVMLAGPKEIAADEICSGDNVLFKFNMTKLLQKVMHEDSSYWKACIFLD